MGGYQTRGQNRDHSREHAKKVERKRAARAEQQRRAISESVIASLPPTNVDPHFPKSWLDAMSEVA